MTRRPMTPDRWRAVDAILQAALACEPARRDAFIADACEDDPAMRYEVDSLLAAHAGAADDFLEQPSSAALGAALDGILQAESSVIAAEGPAPRPLDAEFAFAYPERTPRVPSPAGPVSRRMVPARSAIYAVVAAFVIGVGGALLLDQALPYLRATRDAPEVVGPSTREGDVAMAVVDRTGRALSLVRANRPWTPRFAPDGRHVAYGAFGPGRETSDLWITDLNAGTTRRLTDDDGDANDPVWSPDGGTLAYSVGGTGGKEIALLPVTTDGPRRGRIIAARDRSQFPSDWPRAGGSLLATEEAGTDGYDVIVQPADGSAARPYAASVAHETAARVSPDGRWVAYTSDVSGRQEVYLDSYPAARHRVMLSGDGGSHPAWRGDGAELYYWHGGALVAVQLAPATGAAPPAASSRRELFRSPYPGGINPMYDVSPDGQRFVIVRLR